LCSLNEEQKKLTKLLEEEVGKRGPQTDLGEKSRKTASITNPNTILESSGIGKKK